MPVDLTHARRDSFDPTRYPLLHGLDVPCRYHHVPTGKCCPCTVEGTRSQRGRTRRDENAYLYQLPVFTTLPDVTVTYISRGFCVARTVGTSVAVHLYPYPLRLDAPVHFLPEWQVVVVRDGEPEPQRYRTALTLFHHHVCRLIFDWSRAGTTTADELRALGTALARYRTPDKLHTLAQELWTSPSQWSPTRADGRFDVAGIAEPYPGAWPARAIEAAGHGDYTTLWPYLAEAAT